MGKAFLIADIKIKELNRLDISYVNCYSSNKEAVIKNVPSDASPEILNALACRVPINSFYTEDGRKLFIAASPKVCELLKVPLGTFDSMTREISDLTNMLRDTQNQLRALKFKKIQDEVVIMKFRTMNFWKKIKFLFGVARPYSYLLYWWAVGQPFYF